MTRHTPEDQAGWVNWPVGGDGGWRLGGEGGMAVYAVWLWDVNNPALVCAAPLMPSGIRPVQGVLAGAHGPAAEVFKKYYQYASFLGFSDDVETDIDQVVLLGSTGATWFNDEQGCYFHCRPDDLQPEGRALVDSLARQYNREATLLTLLDT